MKHMPDKLRNRVQFYSQIDETKVIEKSEFPVEYGGKVEGSVITGIFRDACRTTEIRSLFFAFVSCLDRLKKALDSKQEFFLKYNEMKVNRSLYTESVLKCDVDTLGTSLDSIGVIKKEISSYRTLDIEFD